MLRAQWLEIPILAPDEHGGLTWGAFAEGFERCLRDVSLHVSQRVADRAGVEGIVTEVVVDNLGLLASRVGECEKRDCLLGAADVLIARNRRSDAGRSTRWLECPDAQQEKDD